MEVTRTTTVPIRTASGDVIALVPMADGLAFSLSPRFVRFSARVMADRARGHRRPLPAAGPAGAFPPELLHGLERLAAANGWHNEVNASLDHPMFAY